MDTPATQNVLNSFTNIPISDIHLLLTQNNIAVPTDNSQAYQLAQNLLLTNNLPSVPSTSFIDFIVALHVSGNFNVPVYNLSDIQNATDEQLRPLATAFSLNMVDRQRIVRILKFLGGLNSDVTLFEQVPTELLLQTLRYADCNTISRICESGPQFQRACNSNDFLSFMRKVISERNGMATNNLDFAQLRQICKFAPAKNISAGRTHSLVLTHEGQVYYLGQLGLGNLKVAHGPILIPNLNSIVQIFAGSNNSMVVTLDGNVYAFGDNKMDELGLPPDTSRDIPVLIPGLSNIISVSLGIDHTLALRSDGQVYSFGDNKYGQLGIRGIDRGEPRLIPGLNNIIQVAAGDKYSLALTTNGQVYGFGLASSGQLGANYSPIYSPSLIGGLNNIVQIAAGFTHSLVLNSLGQVFIFGSSGYNDLSKQYNSSIPILNGIVSISTKGFISLALTENGQVYSFGIYNYDGQLGRPNNNKTNLIPNLIPNLNNITQISAGYNHSLVADNEGNIYGFGRNKNGELGLYSRTVKISNPTLIPNIHI